MGETGTLDRIKNEEFEWRISDFSSFTGPHAWSPSFSFAGKTWQLELFLEEGLVNDNLSGHLSIFLNRKSSGPPIELEYSLGIKTGDGDRDPDLHSFNPFEKGEDQWGETQMISRCELYERYYLPSDVLTVFCTMWYPTEGATAEIFTETEKPAATEKLCEAFKRILLSGDHSDTTIKVKGEEFRLHKTVLGARSPYFDLMFKNEMKENITGIVTIDDCEPDTFRSYIHFLYAGKVDHISAENVCDLYAVADKYQDDQLREECLQFMVNSISIESFCDYTILAITYKEQKLLNNAIEIFASKTREIIRSVKWQAFLLKYPIQANELLIKAFDHNPAL